MVNFSSVLFYISMFDAVSYHQEEKAASDVTELVNSNNIPTTFLILLLIQFFVIVIDRAIYLRKNVTAKFIFLVIWVIVIHIWLFFILPPINNK